MADLVTPDDVDTYHRVGAVLLRDRFDAYWIDRLKVGVEANMAAPTPRARVWDRDEAGSMMFWDSQAWMGIEQYRQFVMESPAAAIAGQIMGSSSINFFFDAVFVRTAGSQFRTPWHQDEPYWSVSGYDTCTIWMPLVSVAAENALGFVPGSHRGRVIFKQYDFGELNPDEKAHVDHVDFSAIAEEDVPDIESDPAAFGVVSWDMEPGDCVVFNSRILHGGSGRLAPDDELRVFTSKWLGDDVRIVFRSEGMDPDHSAIMTEYGLRPGDRPGTALYPEVWRRPR